ncbi:sulfotransferase [Leptolyngbya sp. AN02str]|uniref:sulfotransferase n=1 Tax=Leptolyngbya sp. AN02str TaxID=3423363 RepID=UPI003D31E381
MSIQKLINLGIYTLNQTDEHRLNPKTIVVLGVARSGTSMVARVLEAMGVFMGDKRDPAVLEDVEVHQALENGDLETFKQIVESRNEKCPQIWGWKRPTAMNYIDSFQNELRNPHFVIVFRDHLAIAVRNSISVNTDVLRNLTRTNREYETLINFCAETQYPVLLVSYEKAILKQDSFLKHLAHFCNVPMDDEKLLEVKKAIELDRPEYLKRARKMPVVGILEPITDGIVRGWAYSNSSQDEIQLDILINQKKVASTVANLPREDVKANDGKVGFFIDIKPFLSPGENEVTVIAPDFDEELLNCPATYFNSIDT